MVDGIEWQPEFTIVRPDKRKPLEHQTAYNARFEIEFQQLGWDIQPRLSDSPRLIGDFGKNLVFGEVGLRVRRPPPRPRMGRRAPALGYFVVSKKPELNESPDYLSSLR